ncbi:hypothetical protein EOE67_14690 [Rheinheimera riviphila]|uniref:Carrier domain-containing protein n=1 Tax=Rheinheimera riviphila TaxID=1834037 RepID=A0A437QJ23_9GAMM|nr:condensation domain-containing protein [Rheinheimera riviphila]RVU34493.1 hypothetical protein EOE67_14690 [Rheinheimera riviphila]
MQDPITLLASLERQGILLALNDAGQLTSKARPGAINADLAALIKAQKTGLQHTLAARARFELPLTVSGADTGPLTSSQSGLWFLSQQSEGLTMYNMPIHFRLYGTLDSTALHWAFLALHYNEPGLRTAFRQDADGEPLQQILAPTDCPLLYQQLDLSALASDVQQQQLQELLSLDIRAPFDLTSGQLSRVVLIKLTPTEHVLVFTQHHLISDGWSIKKLFGRLRQLMAAYQQGERQMPAPPALTFIDYARFERSSACTDYQALFLPYWQQQLAGISALHSIPTDYPRPAVLSSAGQVHFSYLPNARWQQFKQLCQQQGATAFIGVHALIALLLHHYSRDNDLLIGTPIAARDRSDVDELIGFFVNTLLLRTQLDQQLGFVQFLQYVLATDLAAFDHQIQRFEVLPEALQLARSPSANPLFQIMLIYQAMVEFDELLPGIKGRDQVLPDLPAKTDLAIKLTETPEHVRIEWLFSTDLFALPTLEAMATALELCFDQLLADPQRPIGHYQLAATADPACNAADLSQSQLPDPPLQRLAQWAAAQPQQLAIDDGSRRLSYAALATEVAQARLRLQQQGLVAGDRLALLGAPSATLLTLILAAQAEGLTYLPLEPKQPAARLGQLLSDASPVLLIELEASGEPLLWSGPRLDWSGVLPELAAAQPAMLTATMTPAYAPGQPLYLIYTSGSTGQPKGVAVCPQAFNRLLSDHQQRFRVAPGSTLLSPMTLAFDAGHMAALLALYAGSSLYLGSAEQVPALLQQHDIQHLICPTALLQVLDTRQLGACQSLIFGGEACPAGLIQRFPQQRLFNLYGPTEATVTAFCDEVRADRSVGLGAPIRHIQAFILNEQGQHCAPGMAGELVLAGPQLALGYWQGDKLQVAPEAGGFCRGFYAADPTLRIYRSGDLVRRHGDGQLEFLGRRDQQLKLRGYRIEPQEILQALQQQVPTLRQCHVLIRQQQLCAYAVCDGEAPDAEAVLRQLARQLPPYLLPARLIWLQTLPLTSNGKINVAALPEPSQHLSSQTEPLALLEAKLLQLWQQVLPGQYGADADYFAIGGDSLRSIRLTGLVRELGYQCEVRDLFEQRTVRQLAQLLADPKRRQLSLGEQGVLTGEFPLQPVQRWFFDQQYQNPGYFNQAVLCAVPVFASGQWRHFLDQLLAQHDVLGLAVQPAAGTQHYAGIPIELLELDAHSLNAAELVQQSNELQQFALSSTGQHGSLCRAVLWRGGADALRRNSAITAATQAASLSQLPQGHDVLLLICHHLLIDALSWPVLLSDLRRICRSESLASKTHSYRQWGEQLRAYRQQHGAQLTLYRQLCQNALPYRATPATQPEPATLTLNTEHTALLLGSLHQPLGTDPADLLLLAIARTLAQLAICEKPLLALESHGRHALTAADGSALDLSRSVGWFSSLTPVLVDTTTAFSQMLTAAKDQRRLLPDQGIGFLLWASEPTHQLTLPPVVLNYHGVLSSADPAAGQHNGQNHGQADRLCFSPLRLAEPLRTIATDNQHRQLISLHGAVVDGQLQLRQIGGIAGIANSHLLELLQREIQAVLAEAATLALGGKRLTPGDMPTAPTTSTELALLQRQYPLQTVLAATPLQQSMLALALRDPHDRAYHQQIRLDFHGAFDAAGYQQAWQAQTNRYPALRSCLYWQQQPLELVLQTVQIPWHQHELPAALQQAESQQKEQWISQQAVQQLSTGLRLDTAPLLKLQLLQISASHHVLLLLMHHAITDGWSMPNLMSSVQQHYQQLQLGQMVPAAPDQAYLPYRRLLEQTQKTTTAYWQQQLQRPHPGYPLSEYLAVDLRLPTPRQRRELALQRLQPVADSQQLQLFCQQQGITPSVLGLYSWHLLLQQHSRQPISCCGYVVAGRDLPVAGLGQSVGLYNNTVPLLLDWREVDSHSNGLQQLQQQLLSANAHPACPLLQVQSRNHSWYESVFLYENYPKPSPSVDALLRPQLIGEPHEPVELPLGVSMADHGGQLLFACYLDPDQVDPTLAEKLLDAWVGIVWQLCRELCRGQSWQPLCFDAATGTQSAHHAAVAEISLQEPPGLTELLCLLPAELQIRPSQAAQPLQQLGLTSLHKVLLRTRLAQTFACELPVDLFEQADTLYQLLRVLRRCRQTELNQQSF